MLPIPFWPLSTYTPCQPSNTPLTPLCPWHPLTPQWPINAPTPPRIPQCPFMPPIPHLAPAYLHFLPAPQYTPDTSLMSPMPPDTHTPPRNPSAPCATYTLSGPRVPTLPGQPPIHPNTLMAPQHPRHPLHPLVFYHCHFATDCLHEYVQFIIYHL